MCQARDQVANLFDENGVVTTDANIKNAQTLVSEIAKIKPEYAQTLQVQVEEAKEKVSMVSNEVLKASLNESLKLVDKYIEENKTLPESVLLDVLLV